MTMDKAPFTSKALTSGCVPPVRVTSNSGVFISRYGNVQKSRGSFKINVLSANIVYTVQTLSDVKI